MLISESPVDPNPLAPIVVLVVLEFDADELEDDVVEPLELPVEMRLVAACRAEDILLPLPVADELVVAFEFAAFDVTVTVGLAALVCVL